MLFDVKTVNKLLGIDESYKAPEKMLQLMLDDQKRVEIFKKFLEISTNMQFDWFHEYFEDEQAERKTKKQDFTPQGIADLMSAIVGKNPSGTYYEPAADTGTSREDVVFHILCSTYKNAISMLMAKG